MGLLAPRLEQRNVLTTVTIQILDISASENQTGWSKACFDARQLDSQSISKSRLSQPDSIIQMSRKSNGPTIQIFLPSYQIAWLKTGQFKSVLKLPGSILVVCPFCHS
jgi:hypothetical protein